MTRLAYAVYGSNFCVGSSPHLFIINCFPSLCLVIFRNPIELIRIKGKFSLRPSAYSSFFSFTLRRSTRTWLARAIGRQPGLGQFEIADGSLALLVVANGPYPGSLLLCILARLFCPLKLLLLRQEVLQGAFAAENVPSWARDRLSGVFQAQTAESKGQE